MKKCLNGSWCGNLLHFSRLYCLNLHFFFFFLFFLSVSFAQCGLEGSSAFELRGKRGKERLGFPTLLLLTLTLPEQSSLRIYSSVELCRTNICVLIS